MRHRNHRSKLNRTSEHRAALMRNLAIALVEHERIRTTEVKAKQLRPFVETLVTRARENTLTNKRLVLSRLNDRLATSKLFDEIGPRNSTREGGYLRIVRDGIRMGDGAPMAFIEFVDAVIGGPEASGGISDRRKMLKQKMHQRRKEMARMRKEQRA